MTTILAVALGAYALTSFIRLVMPWALQPWTKMSTALMWCSVLTWLSGYGGEDTPTAIWRSVGAWGLAMVIHKTVRLLSAYGDVAQTTVITRASASGRPIR